MAKILPILLMLLGLAGGAGAGFVLRPAPEPLPEGHADRSGSADRSPCDRAFTSSTDSSLSRWSRRGA